MEIIIRNRWTNEPIYTAKDVENVLQAVTEAVGKKADLEGADLKGAYLEGADHIVHIQHAGFDLWIQAEKSKIGCKYRTNEEWLKMSRDEAVRLGIKPGHYEAYRALLKSGIEALQIETAD